MKTQIAAFIGLFLLLNFGLGKLLELPKKDLIEKDKYDPKLRWEEFHALEPNTIDVLFLGSSHAYRSFNPKTFDAESKQGRSFNLGSSSQTPVTAYFVLKEALKTQRPKVLIYELYFLAFETSEQFVNATYNFEYMRSPDVRREFLLKGYEPSDLVHFLLPAVRYRGNAVDTLRLLLGRRVEYKKDFYAGAGYVENTEVVSEEELRDSPMFRNYRFDPEKLEEKQVEYFRKIIELCRENGIRPIFVTSPLPGISLSMIENYAGIHAYFRRAAEAEGIPYYDYNLINAEEGLFGPGDFKDADHLNKAGAEKISADLARRLGKLY